MYPKLVLFLATLLLSCNQQSPKGLAEQIELIRKENDSLIRANNKLENSYPKTVLGEANERLLLDSLLRNSENQVYFFRLYLCREFSDLLIQGSFDGKKAELFYTISNYSECHYNKIDTQHYLTKKIYVPISKRKWEDLYHQFEMFEQEDLSSDPSYYFGNPISCTYYLYVYAREKYETPHNWRITKKSVSYSAKDQLPNTKFYNFVLYLTALCKLEGGKNDTLFDFSKDL